MMNDYCDECLAHTYELVSDEHDTECSLHPNNVQEIAS